MQTRTEHTNEPVYIPLSSAPHSTTVLVLGILSIGLFCCCYGIVGLILGIIALILAAQGKSKYSLAPHQYTEGSFANLKAGRICAIIGLILSALMFAFMLAAIFSESLAFLSDSTYWQEFFDELNK